jgi:hypothetical protein
MNNNQRTRRKKAGDGARRLGEFLSVLELNLKNQDVSPKE